jgi:pullulanase
MDGFRFDLMGLLDVELMNRIQHALDEDFGVGEKHIYGEPWGASASAVRPGTHLAHKDNMGRLDGAIGAFCDNTRDAVKGNLMDEKSRGFVNGGYVSPEYLCCCLTGWAAGPHRPFQTPRQTITYLSCHDDWTLWDKLVYTMDPQKDFDGCGVEIKRANRLAAAIYFSCQGRIFIHAGEEFGRTKGGVKNSYCSSAEINRLDWERTVKNRDLVDYYRGLIALRKQLPGLQDKSAKAKDRILKAFDIALNCSGILLDNKGENSKWEKLFLCFNCSEKSVNLSLPEGNWQVLADGENAFRWEESMYVKEKTEIPPKSDLVLGL